MTTSPQLPADLTTAITTWAADAGLTRTETADAVRSHLPTSLDNIEPGLSTATGEGRIVSTRVGYVETAFQAAPARFTEALEYSNEFHPDGRMATRGDSGNDLTRVRMVVGETHRIGNWTWTAGPLALVGVWVDHVKLPGADN